MKKIFTLIASLMMVFSMNAATKTIYFKTQQWWHKDGAASAAYYWGTGGNANAWPGTRMTKVEGETNVWSIDIDTDKYQKIIFTRVNGSGTVQDWGAKTKDQTIPTNDNNFFTLSTTEVWGDPGATGTWSVYTPTVTHTFAKNSTLYIDFRAITDASKKGANYPKAGTASELDYSANAGGTVIPVTFTADVKWTEGAEFMKTDKGGWTSIPFKAPATGQNCAQVAADGKSYTWTTYSEPSVTLSLDKTEADAGTEVTVTLTATADNVSGEVTYAFQYSTDNATWSNITATGNTATQTFAAETRYYKVTMTNGGTTKEATAKFSAIKFHVIGSWDSWAAHNEVVEGSKTITLEANKTYDYKITNGTWDLSWGNDGTMTRENCTNWSFEASGNAKITTDEAGDYVFNVSRNGEGKVVVSVTYPELVTPIPTFDYYIAGSFNDWNKKDANYGMTLDGEVYKATITLPQGDNHQFKVTNGKWSNEDGGYDCATLGAAYEEVSYQDGNIKISLAEETEVTIIYNASTEKITLGGLTEKAPAEPVTVYFINSGNWAEVACYYWGGLNGSAWPGVQMTATGETYEAEGWNVYAITFPGDNTKCIFTDNKAEGTTQTADLEVQNGKYYCYANGIWYERLADVDPLDTRVYLKGDMNEWCTIEGWCDMFRKETVDGTVAYRTVLLEEANTTYEFKIEDAGAWLSNTGTMTKDDCTDWTFEADKDNCKITTEYVGEYTFVWDMTTKKLSVVYPELVPTVMDLVVTNMAFDGDNMTFSGSDNEYGIVFNLVVGDEIEDGVFALDASSTVDFGGTPFTDVTGMIAPDMNTFASATAIVKGFLGGSEYFQFNLDMSAGGGTPVEIWDGVATPNDGTGELTISANWDGDDVYVIVPGFNYANYECPEVWFYVGGTTWETASIAAYGPATITVEDGGVLVEGSVMSGVTGTSYELMVFGLLPVEEPTPDYTRTVTPGNYGTICLPFGGEITGAVLYEVSWLKEGVALYLDELAAGAKLEAGKPYIFKATASEIAVTYEGEEALTPDDGVNGLTGTFSEIAAGGVLVDNYIIAQNKIWVAGASNTLPANRAYIDKDGVPTTEQPKLAGRRRVCMGENAATGLDNITNGENITIKVIENGQLIIIRNGEKFNAQGIKL